MLMIKSTQVDFFVAIENKYTYNQLKATRLNYNDEELIINGDGRFFYNVDKFDTIINYIQNINRFVLSKLDDICEEFDYSLHKYQNINKMTDRRINKTCTSLSNRINKLKRIIDSK